MTKDMQPIAPCVTFAAGSPLQADKRACCQVNARSTLTGGLQHSPLLCSACLPGAVLWRAVVWRVGGNVERAGDWLFSHMDDLPAAIAAIKGGAAGGAGAAAAGGDAAAGNRYGRLPWFCCTKVTACVVGSRVGMGIRAVNKGV